MPRPATHLLDVEMRVKPGAALRDHVDLVMPVWTPGSYLIREYERNVQDFEARDAAGAQLDWGKINKDTWRVRLRGPGQIVVTYRVYCNELSVRTNEVTDRSAFWTGAALLMYVDGFLRVPATVEVRPQPGWQLATGLPAVPGETDTFRAENFDVLYDSPFQAGNLRILPFEVRGVPHRIVIEGTGDYDADRLVSDFKRFVETEVAMMPEIPYHDYTFLIRLRSAGGGGLEHLNSTALIFRRTGFRSAASYRGVLSTAAHEFFHLWNVKRIRPDALGPFDYTKENYTKLLWVAEGFTDYYANLFLRRAGLISEATYLETLATSIQRLQNTPGRLEMSAEEASFDAWIKYYRPDENAVNSQISYYEKGALLGLLLDLRIRGLTGGTRSLDDVMRYLYNEYYKKGRNYTPLDFQRACETIAGTTLEDFFRRYVHGRDELDYNQGFAVVGLRLETGTPASGARAWFGATLARQGDHLMVNAVLAGSPAYDQGLNAGDEILAVDNMRVTDDAWLAEKRPGDTVHLVVFRSDLLRTLDVKLGTAPPAGYRIVPEPGASPDAQRQYRGWIGAPTTP